ncbi:hypothetical protein BGZ98_006714 [Dissophora globulifera]|nr:hypothetical protein BGZ98_006714 [Dissophora globulifera]
MRSSNISSGSKPSFVSKKSRAQISAPTHPHLVSVAFGSIPWTSYTSLEEINSDCRTISHTQRLHREQMQLLTTVQSVTRVTHFTKPQPATAFDRHTDERFQLQKSVSTILHSPSAISPNYACGGSGAGRISEGWLTTNSHYTAPSTPSDLVPRGLRASANVISASTPCLLSKPSASKASPSIRYPRQPLRLPSDPNAKLQVSAINVCSEIVPPNAASSSLPSRSHDSISGNELDACLGGISTTAADAGRSEATLVKHFASRSDPGATLSISAPSTLRELNFDLSHLEPQENYISSTVQEVGDEVVDSDCYNNNVDDHHDGDFEGQITLNYLADESYEIAVFDMDWMSPDAGVTISGLISPH